MSIPSELQIAKGDMDFQVDLFAHMSCIEAKEYFLQLFCGTLEMTQLETIWYNVPKDANLSLQISLCVECAVAMLEAEELRTIELQDSMLAAKLLKAERRSGSKKRNKSNKKSVNELNVFLRSPVGASLSELEVKAFFAVKEVLGQCLYQYSTESIVEALKLSQFNPDIAVDQLLSFKNEDTTALQPDQYCSRTYAEASRSSSSKDSSGWGNASKIKNNTCLDAASSTAASSKKETTTICIESSISSNKSASLASTTAVSVAVAPSALTQYYLLLLRHRNPGIVAFWDGEALLYKGTKAELSVFENSGELVVSIDLHGQTRKPAVDLLQSSLLYFHNILLTRNYDQCLTLNFINSGRTSTVSNNRPRSADIKSIVVVYVVGQGIHSPGAVPVLRNTLMNELQTFWSIFDAEIDPENQGQILVKMRRC